MVDDYHDVDQKSHPLRRTLAFTDSSTSTGVSAPSTGTAPLSAKVDWSVVDQDLVDGMTRALEEQRQAEQQKERSLEVKKEPLDAAGAGELLSRILAGGVTVLEEEMEKGIELKVVRNANGMSLLHAAAASSSEYAEEIVREVIERRWIDVNDRCKV